VIVKVRDLLRLARFQKSSVTAAAATAAPRIRAHQDSLLALFYLANSTSIHNITNTKIISSRHIVQSLAYA
jgi:hypothetical protein